MKPKRNIVRSGPSALTCSTCGGKFLIDETEVPPFCSVRCQQIDLGRWLDEAIGVPQESGDEAFDQHIADYRESDEAASDDR